MLKKDGGHFLINFHPTGELEAPICCVIKGSQSAKELWRMASPLNALQMKSSNSCKIQVEAFTNFTPAATEPEIEFLPA